MNKIILLFCLLQSFLSKKKAKNHLVKEVNINSFDRFLRQNPHSILVSCNKGEKHCKNMFKQYNELAQELKKRDPPIPVAFINKENNAAIINRYLLKKNNDILHFHHGEPLHYKGKFDIQKILEFIDQEKEFRVLKIHQDDNIEEIFHTNIGVLFIMSPKLDTDTLITKYNSMALNYPNSVFAYTTSQKLKKKYEIKHHYGFVVFRKYDESIKKIEFHGMDHFTRFKKFFRDIRMPPVLDYNEHTLDLIHELEKNVLFYFSSKENDDHALLREAQKKYPNSFVYVYVNIRNPISQRLVAKYQIKESCFRVYNYTTHKKYHVEGQTGQEIHSNALQLVRSNKNDFIASELRHIPESDSWDKLVASDFSDQLSKRVFSVIYFYDSFEDKHRLEEYYSFAEECDFKNVKFFTYNLGKNDHPFTQNIKHSEIIIYLPEEKGIMQYTKDLNCDTLRRVLTNKKIKIHLKLQKIEFDEL